MAEDPKPDDKCAICGGTWQNHLNTIGGKRGHRIIAPGEPQDGVWHEFVPLPPKEAVKHPDHYGGKDNPYEHIKVVTAWGLDYHTGNATKYIARAGKKDPEKEVEDLEKAIFYLQHKVDLLKSKKA